MNIMYKYGFHILHFSFIYVHVNIGMATLGLSKKCHWYFHIGKRKSL